MDGVFEGGNGKLSKQYERLEENKRKGKNSKQALKDQILAYDSDVK